MSLRCPSRIIHSWHTSDTRPQITSCERETHYANKESLCHVTRDRWWHWTRLSFVACCKVQVAGRHAQPHAACSTLNVEQGSRFIVHDLSTRWSTCAGDYSFDNEQSGRSFDPLSRRARGSIGKAEAAEQPIECATTPEAAVISLGGRERSASKSGRPRCIVYSVAGVTVRYDMADRY